MLTTFILTLTFGISLGFLLATYLFLYHFKINCPKCKQPKSLKEIMIFNCKKIQVLKNTASQNSSFTLSELELIEALKKEKAELLKDIQQKEKELSEKDK